MGLSAKQKEVMVLMLQAFVDLISMKSKEHMDSIIESFVSFDLPNSTLDQYNGHSRWSRRFQWAICDNDIKPPSKPGLLISLNVFAVVTYSYV